ncbi:hydroxyacylglutathione hydrolase [Pseudoalteromonas sp. MMG010]|uniref:hydroxyacylglutathione hydrolase n=1 Tax=Pseudoalteromonas sp. MMG010 TaxID=2822685 RepID=UPI001B3A6235|nr:hydroxyacylglutathione hydrolase [Pseudoalteromonas sp. MMG010]MBQ4831646.1 hydroxyacylglutathione hydrolase [Pseudoalteromonas sp. MMG010]
MVQVKAIKAFSDNYIWCLTHNADNQAIVVDPGQAQPVIDELTKNNLTLEAILITHHHYDHTDGVNQLIKLFPQCKVYGPNNSPFKGITHPLTNNDTITVLNTTFTVLTTPGHTLDHICYVNEAIAFTGDTLFSGGCGRLFEGTAQQMWQSFNALAELQPTCKVYCTHEYTQANLAFAKAIEPNNEALKAYSAKVDDLRKQNQITLPTTIAQEMKINPFMRSQLAHITHTIPEAFIHQSDANEPWANFASIRRYKDNF